MWEDEQEEAARVMFLVFFCGGEFMSIYDFNFKKNPAILNGIKWPSDWAGETVQEIRALVLAEGPSLLLNVPVLLDLMPFSPSQTPGTDGVHIHTCRQNPQTHNFF